jgi:5-methylcytosine-specific restriction endonuclease McrA
MSNYTTDDNYIPLKRCAKGDDCVHPMGCWQPATPEYFYRRSDRSSGLYSQCKACRDEYERVNKDKIADRKRIYRAANKEKIAARQQEYNATHKEERRAYLSKWLQENPDYNREYHQANKDAITKQRREYYKAHKDEIIERQRKWEQENKEAISHRRRQYRLANKDKIARSNSDWQKANPDKIRIYRVRYKARKRQLPDTFTVEQWQACLEYHHYCCAVCGVQLRDLFGDIEPHADHWIPLSNPDCPGTVAENMVCLCGDCNISKKDRLPQDWLVWKFGKRQAVKILSRIHAYFEWVTG